MIKSGLKTKKNLLILCFVFLLFGFAYFLNTIITRDTPISSYEKEVSSYYKDMEASDTKITDDSLKQKDYETYQVTLLGYVRGYQESNQPKEAWRVIEGISKNVPEDKLSLGYYMQRSAVAKKLRYKNEFTQSTQKIISIYNDKNNTEQAKLYEEELKNGL
jgi:hypothetical protein